MTWKEGFIEIARDRQVTGEMFRVLFVILGSLEGTNSTNMTQAEIARALDINKERFTGQLRIQSIGLMPSCHTNA